jgi:hypothetical protein
MTFRIHAASEDPSRSVCNHFLDLMWCFYMGGLYCTRHSYPFAACTAPAADNASSHSRFGHVLESMIPYKACKDSRKDWILRIVYTLCRIAIAKISYTPHLEMSSRGVGTLSKSPVFLSPYLLGLA